MVEFFLELMEIQKRKLREVTCNFFKIAKVSLKKRCNIREQAFREAVIVNHLP